MSDKKHAVDEAMKVLNKKFGADTVMKTADADAINIVAMPTGSLKLDYVIGCGGIPRGRIIELFGPESSGKSSLAYSIVAKVQRGGGKCVWVDAEHCYDSVYARDLGVKTDELIVAQPDYGEKALDIIDEMAKSSAIDLIVLDSVAALVTKKEMDADLVDEGMALLARLMSKYMRKINTILSEHDTTAIFINQLREKVGLVYGPKEVTPGGRALKFFASVRLEVKRGEVFKDPVTKEIFGHEMVVTGRKNKVGLPGRTVTIDWLYRQGIDAANELLDVAQEQGIVTKSGNALFFHETKLGGSEGVAQELLHKDKQVTSALQKEVMDKMESLSVQEIHQYAVQEEKEEAEESEG